MLARDTGGHSGESAQTTPEFLSLALAGAAFTFLVCYFAGVRFSPHAFPALVGCRRFSEQRNADRVGQTALSRLLRISCRRERN